MAITDIPAPHTRSLRLSHIWIVALAFSAAFWLFGKPYFPWAFKFPRAWVWQFKNDISAFMKWLLEEASFGLFTFTDVTRGIAWLLDVPLTIATSILSSGFLKGQGSDAVQVLPPLTWVAVIAIVMALGLYASGWRLALFVGACFSYLAIFGQWESSMVTLSSIVIAVPFGVIGGLLLGLLAHRYVWIERLIRPVLDLMQTVPVFAYLVPILFLFGFGPVAAMIATIIYAMPPMVRVTMLALSQVPSEVIDLGRMTGCSPRQMRWKILVPSARDGLMIGVNQVIMLSLNMVIIASMIGAGGLGYDVLASLRRLDIGAGIEAGVAIVVLAIALDRLSQAFANRRPEHLEDAPAQNFLRRYPYSAACLAIVIVTGVLGLGMGWLQTWPEEWTITTGTFWSEVVKYINITFFDELEAVKTFMLVNFMVPLKRFLLSLPWPVVAGLLGLAGYSLGGWRLGLLCAVLTLFIAIVGLWPKAMVTVYLCGIAVIIACLIGIPIGIASASGDKVWRVVRVVIDTLQTLPSFVYLMPVVMLFRVGDFTAMIAVIAYAIAPAIRYTAHGLRQVDPQLIEAGIATGCTRGQLMRKIQLKLALPEILLGLNQTIMLALS
ncbi:MAG: ABC transporter permease, partial [Hyphomicrobiales bacterium]